MEIKIALATSDGVNVDQHFGRARRFEVYAVRDGVWEYRETRLNTPACAGQEHADDLLEQTAELLADCRGVVVEQIGATAMDVLIDRRILPFTMPGTIEQALEALKDSRYLKSATK